jgi:hypothetical protein
MVVLWVALRVARNATVEGIVDPSDRAAAEAVFDTVLHSLWRAVIALGAVGAVLALAVVVVSLVRRRQPAYG